MNLDQLFNKAKNQAPLMDMDQVKNLLQNPPPPSKFAPKKSWYFKPLLASVAVVMTVAGLLFFQNNKNNNDKNNKLVVENKTQVIDNQGISIENNDVDNKNKQAKTQTTAQQNPQAPIFKSIPMTHETELDSASSYSPTQTVVVEKPKPSMFKIKTKEVVFNGKDSSSRFRLFGDSIFFQSDIKAPHIELRQAQYAYIGSEESIHIRYLDLDPLDLKKLGITLNEKGMFYNNNIAGMGRLQLCFEESLDLNRHSGAQHYSPTYSAGLDEDIPTVLRNTQQSKFDFYPYLTTDTKGSEILTYMFDKTRERAGFYALQGENVFEDAALRDQLNKLIPIRVRLKEHEMLLWFTLTPAFLKALPAQMAAEISNDLNVIQRKTAATNCRYFEVCRSNFNLINKVRTYPNPVIDTPIHVEFELSMPQTLRIALHDMEGNEIRELQAASTPMSKGSNSMVFNTDNLANGMYILVFSNNNTYATQRVLVQR